MVLHMPGWPLEVVFGANEENGQDKDQDKGLFKLFSYGARQ